MLLSIFLSLSLLLLSENAIGQTSITGTLYEKGTKKLLPDTNVFLLPLKLKAVSNLEGKFIFPDVPIGEYDLVINKSGYIRLKEKINTLENKTEFYLEKEFYDIFETVVTGKEVKKDITKKVLSQKDFLKAPGAQEDPVRAVQNLPGVANQSFSAQVVIQGSEPDDTRYSINGHEIPLIFHFGGVTSVVTPTAVKDVEYLSAGFGPEYGRALGGIINLNTRKPKEDRWYGESFLDITKLGFLTEGPINEKSSMIVSARISYFGAIFERIAEEEEDFAVTAAPEFQDYYLNYNYKLSDTENFNLVAISSKDTLNLIVKEGDDPNLEGDISNNTNFNRIIPRYTKKINSKTDLDVSIAVGNDNLNFSLGDRFFDLKATSITQRGEISYKRNEKETYILGTDIQYRKFSLDILFPSSSSGGGVNSSSGSETFASLEDDGFESGVYLRNIYKYNEKLTVSPNLRIDNYSATDETLFSPRINSTYELSSSLKANFATGLYYQAPQNGEANSDFGNPEVVSEKAIHYFASLEKDFRGGATKGLVLEVGAFYKDLSNLIVNTSAVKSDGTPIRNTNDGTGNVFGLQVQGSYKIDEITVLTSYTYLESNRTDPENGTYPSQFDQRHNLNLIGIYERSRWSYSARLRYVSGGPFTPIIGSIYNADNDFYSPIRGNFFSERFEDFFQLDLRVDKKFIYNKWILSAYLDIQNLTNSNNGQSISYSYDFSQSEQAAGLPILPIIGVRGEF